MCRTVCMPVCACVRACLYAHHLLSWLLVLENGHCEVIWNECLRCCQSMKYSGCFHSPVNCRIVGLLWLLTQWSSCLICHQSLPFVSGLWIKLTFLQECCCPCMNEMHSFIMCAVMDLMSSHMDWYNFGIDNIKSGKCSQISRILKLKF